MAVLVKRNFACNVISEATFLAVERIAVLLTFWMKCRTNCFLMIISSFFLTIFVLSDYPSFKKQKKNLVAQAEYNEEAHLDLLLYFVLFEHEAAILHSSMKHCTKIMMSNVGLHIFFSCLLSNLVI